MPFVVLNMLDGRNITNQCGPRRVLWRLVAPPDWHTSDMRKRLTLPQPALRENGPNQDAATTTDRLTPSYSLIDLEAGQMTATYTLQTVYLPASKKFCHRWIRLETFLWRPYDHLCMAEQCLLTWKQNWNYNAKHTSNTTAVNSQNRVKLFL